MSEIHEAIEAGDIAALRALLIADPSAINRPVASQFYSPLAHAVRDMDRSYDMLELLVKSGADVNWKTIDGYTPLHLNIDLNGPSGSGELPYQVAALLKEHGADVEAKNHYGWTPLLRAGLEGTADEFSALLKIGASYAVRYPSNSMPEFTRGQTLAQIVLPRPEIISLLLQHGLQPTAELLGTAAENISAETDQNSAYVSGLKESIRLLSAATLSTSPPEKPTT